MNKMKKFASIATAVLMTACMTAPMMSSFAATLKPGETGNTITINEASKSDPDKNDDSTHTLAAYQIFAGEYAESVLSNIEFGDAVDGAKLSQALVKASGTTGHALNGLFPQLTKDGTNVDYTASQIAEIISKTEKNNKSEDVPVFGYDSDKAKAFASIVGASLKTSAPTSGTFVAVEGANKAKIEGLPDGYYLIQDSAAPTGNDPAEDNEGAKTRFILAVAGSETANVTIKASAPSVMKKVQEESLVNGTTETTAFAGDNAYDLGDGYNDIADYDINDQVPFKLYGSLPADYTDYKMYYYKFTDTLGPEFTAPAKTDVKVYIDGKEVLSGVTVDVNGQVITVEFANLKAIAADTDNYVKVKQSAEGTEGVAPTIDETSKITVEYKATLSSTAKIGIPGQRNKVQLTYSNNPEQEYYGEDGTTPDTPETGDTPEDGVIVFTYGVDINKVQEDNETQLAGAAFAVYKEVESTLEFTVGTDKVTGTKYSIPAASAGGTATTVYKVGDKYYIVAGDAGAETGTEYTLADGVTPELAPDKMYATAADGKFTGFITTKPTVAEGATPENNPAAGLFVSTDTDKTDPKKNLIKIEGLDAGTYYVEEIKAPAGYNAISDPIPFIITAKMAENRQAYSYSDAAATLDENAKTAFKELKFNYAVNGTSVDIIDIGSGTLTAEKAGNTIIGAFEDGQGVMTIANKKGSSLPGTGGIGTTLFYVGGGAMVAVAGVFLITKKRMSKKED